MRVDIAQMLLDEIRERADKGAPDEVCGILVGRREPGAMLIERVLHTANVHENPRTEYRIPPADLARAMLDAEDAWGLEVLGFYHSHPRGPPHLSARDVARASWPGAAYLLAWTQDGTRGVACWTWNPARGAFEPCDLAPS